MALSAPLVWRSGFATIGSVELAGTQPLLMVELLIGHDVEIGGCHPLLPASEAEAGSDVQRLQLGMVLQMVSNPSLHPLGRIAIRRL